MNLFHNREKVLEALVKVEGEDWLKRQKAGQFQGFSVFEAIEKLEREFLPNNDFPIHVIYGDHGWNRYRVTLGGEVEFIGLQARSKESRKTAEDVGFTIV
jgi:hypothetical protein